MVILINLHRTEKYRNHYRTYPKYTEETREGDAQSSGTTNVYIIYRFEILQISQD